MICQPPDTRELALVVEYDPTRMTTDESTRALNRALREGWRVVSMHPMGGVGTTSDCPRFASLVILAREIKDATS